MKKIICILFIAISFLNLADEVISLDYLKVSNEKLLLELKENYHDEHKLQLYATRAFAVPHIAIGTTYIVSGTYLLLDDSEDEFFDFRAMAAAIVVLGVVDFYIGKKYWSFGSKEYKEKKEIINRTLDEAKSEEDKILREKLIAKEMKKLARKSKMYRYKYGVAQLVLSSFSIKGFYDLVSGEDFESSDFIGLGIGMTYGINGLLRIVNKTSEEEVNDKIEERDRNFDVLLSPTGEIGFKYKF